jgi:hypothetical protein
MDKIEIIKKFKEELISSIVSKLEKSIDEFFKLYDNEINKLLTQKQKFKIGDVVHIDSDMATHDKKYGIIENHNMYNNTSEVVDLGFTNHVYDHKYLKKITISHPNKDEIEIGSLVQVKGNRHRFSRHYGIVEFNTRDIMSIGFGNDLHEYHIKNIKLIK